MKKQYIITTIILALFLAACTSTSSETEATDNTINASSSLDEIIIAETAILNTDYSNALSLAEQLALGSTQLEETDLAIDEAQAETLLPLWQAWQSLSTSESAADIEREAVLTQIQGEMNAAQLQAIADMQLTTEDFEAVPFGQGFRGGGGERPEGDQRPEGGPGGGGGVPGGRPGGGGGPGGLGGGQLTEEQIAERLEQFQSADMQTQLLTGNIIRLLQTKTGDAPLRQANRREILMTEVSEALGLTPEEIQTQMVDGVTLSEIIVEQEGDLEAIRQSLIETLQEQPNAEQFDIEQFVNEWLPNS